MWTSLWLMSLSMPLGASWLLGALAADVCPNTGMVSPDVITLVASPQQFDGPWLVGPDCEKDVTVGAYKGYQEINGGGIERVASLPNVYYSGLDIKNNPLSRGGDFSNVSGTIGLDGFSPSCLSRSTFANNRGISLRNSAITTTKDIKFPDGLQSFSLDTTQVKSLKGISLPDTLTALSVYSSPFATIDFLFPPFLKSLWISKTPLSRIDRVVFPDSLQSIHLEDNQISTVRGVTWPGTLLYLHLNKNPLVEFEIRQSDVAMFSALESWIGDSSQVKCSDESGRLVTILSQNVCVISDERFEALYRVVPTSPTDSPASTSSSTPTLTSKPKVTKKPSTRVNGTSSMTYDPEESIPDEQEASDPSASASGSRIGRATEQEQSSKSPKTGSMPQDINGSITPSSMPSQRDSVNRGSPSTSKTTIIQTKAASKRTVTTVFVVLGTLAVVVLNLWIFLACVKTKKSHRDRMTRNDKYLSAATPTTSTETRSNPSGSNGSSNNYLGNDLRNDKTLLKYRIGMKDVKLNKQIAHGGYGVIYRGVYEGKDVAVKQMLPGTWQDDRALASFMDEIRLCATLDHPKIVSFVGIAYSSLRDLSVVIEFMPGGDLHALLKSQQQKPRSSQHWSQPWTSAQIKPKASIGQDVAEAVAYLHSRETPILHRDLKARNVLLDLEGKAKLSDFGISRELTLDETMTGEIGTAAWIAPEVLRGARYSEKADIYSLGVLLVELDRCQHPYASEPIMQRQAEGGPGCQPNMTSNIAQKDIQMAVFVSTGKLRPSVSNECPEQIASLVARCLSFDPVDRPTAEEVANALERVRRLS